MRDAGLRRRLVPRAGPDPEPEGHRAHRGNLLGDDPDARVELGYLSLVGGSRRAQRRRPPSRSRRRPPPSRSRLRAPPRPPPSRPPPRGPGRRCRRRRAPPPTCPRLGVVGEAQADPAALRSTSTTVTSISSPGVEDVLDRVDPLARLHVGDVEQAVGALGQLDEGAEGGRLDDLGRRVAVADLGLLGHRLDPRDAGFDQVAGRARRSGPCRRPRRRSRPRTPRRGRGSSRRPCRSRRRSSPGRS